MSLRHAAKQAHSAAEAHARVMKLYKSMVAAVPNVINVYDMNMTPSDLRALIKKQFLRNADVKDPRVIDMLVVKGWMDLEETLLQFKQKTHLAERLQISEIPKHMLQHENPVERFLGQRLRGEESPADEGVPDLRTALSKCTRAAQ